jgi:hypothetical protein
MLYENKIEERYGENLKNLLSSLKSLKLYFDNFHCEIIKYNFHGLISNPLKSIK